MAELSSLQHAWDLPPTQAVTLQRDLRQHIDLHELAAPPTTIAGADISYNKFSDVIYAGILVLDYATQQPILRATVVDKMKFPYIPGLLSFREIPAYIEAWKLLPFRPDVVMLDGHGIAHPRRLGIATHFGLIAGVPTLGCGKKVLVGRFGELAPAKGSYEPMIADNDTIGYAVRTKDKVNPVYISPGTGMSLADARQIALHCARGYRLPEPTRRAHLLVNELRRGEVEPGVFRYERTDLF